MSSLMSVVHQPSAPAVLRMAGVELEMVSLKPEDLATEGMEGFRRYLAQVGGARFCQIAFSLNASLRRRATLRDVFKKQPQMIREARKTAESLISEVLQRRPEEGISTFVLDMSSSDKYEDEAHIRESEEKMAAFLGSRAGKADGCVADSFHLIRPGMSFFIAEGSVKCKLVKLMEAGVRERLQTNAEGKMALCMMGLVVIHVLQYGYKLVHKETGAELTPASVFYDLEEGEPILEDVPGALAGLRASFTTMTMFPGRRYADSYAANSAYVQVMSELSTVTHATYDGAGQVECVECGELPTQVARVAVAAGSSEPSVLVAFRGLGDSAPSPTPTPSSASDCAPSVPSARSAAYAPAEAILAGELRRSALSLEEKVERVRQVCGNGGELVGESELWELLQKKAHPICYDGFEPSGRMHVAQGILKAVNVNRLTEAGCVFVFWVADWFALMNNKMGGDLLKIQTVGRYFVEVWKAAGMDMQNVRFLWASEELKKSPDYWLLVLNISRAFSLTRVKRCMQIMGRAESDDQPAAAVIYPCMQCADVFYLGADICQLGMDQRKVNVLAREFLDKQECRERRAKPIIASHGMVPGLLQGQAKMSKSDPDSAIFMEDSEEDVRKKIRKAYCPPQEVDNNPCVQYVKMIVFPAAGRFLLSRSEENGGSVTFESFRDFEAAYAAGDVHPKDLKSSLVTALNAMIRPVREHFQSDPEAARLLKTVRGFCSAEAQ